MKHSNDALMYLLTGLVSIITLAVLLQSPVDRLLLLGTCGFALFTFAWVGMYFRLKRELPEHALVHATYLNFPGFGNQRRAGFHNMVRLVKFHFERHGVGPLSMLLVAGLAMLAASFIRSAV